MRIILTAQAPSEALSRLAPLAGPGSLVCCAPQPDAVATAQRLYPDRRIEVKTLYREPGLHHGRWLPAWMLKAQPGEESHEDLRRRLIDTSVRLVGVAKEEDEAVFVGGPRLLRLLAIKLNSIGYRGTLLSGWKAGEGKGYQYVT
jgi:hypothetical protein